MMNIAHLGRRQNKQKYIPPHPPSPLESWQTIAQQHRNCSTLNGGMTSSATPQGPLSPSPNQQQTETTAKRNDDAITGGTLYRSLWMFRCQRQRSCSFRKRMENNREKESEKKKELQNKKAEKKRNT